MTTIRCRPLDQWAGPYTGDRRAAPFTARWDTILADLERELDLLDATDVTIGIQALTSDIRNDGWPKGGRAIPPPVSLTFDSRVGPLRFQCDRWSDYRANLRAIGLTLQRLRLVDEGGVARSGEQYRGWGALPPGPIAVGAAMTVEQAARFIAEHADPGWIADVEEDPSFALALFKDAAKRLHPDAGGDPDLFRRLVEARDIIEAHQ